MTIALPTKFDINLRGYSTSAGISAASDHAHGREEQFCDLNDGAVETATCLLRWCPHQARAFALAMHELAAWQYDDSKTKHWRNVLRLLPKISSYVPGQDVIVRPVLEKSGQEIGALLRRS